MAGLIGAAVIGTFLLAYQVEIWLATDAPLLASTAAALLGAYVGFYAVNGRERLGGYTLMHVAIGAGFMSKSAAALMVPALTLVTLIAWERRWRELLCWQLYAGLLIPAAMILAWVACVYVEPDGLAHLKVFFWNNLAGRFARIDAPAPLQYAAAHRNSPGKYFIELPMYLFPWTFAAMAAVRRAWVRRRTEDARAVRFAVCAFLPALLLLSLAATARNVYLAPALPGAALLIGWWGKGIVHDAEPWDLWALRATAVLLLLSTAVLALATGVLRLDAGASLRAPAVFIGLSSLGVILAALLGLRAWNSAKRNISMAQCALLAAYGALLLGPVAVIYGQVDRWQNLESIARDVRRDTSGSPLLLLAPDETTRAIVDMYVSTSVLMVDGPLDATAMARASTTSTDSGAFVLALLPGRGPPQSPWLAEHLPPAKSALPAWANFSELRTLKEYVLPNGRRYALLKSTRR
jgi:4-amino-4-deoxy-L-arabinose transferase-like glycosyltransferase